MAETAQQEFTITRVFNAPRDLVFKAWTECGRLRHWWGPKGFTMSVCKLELRPGGVFHYCLRSPEGQEMWGKFVYREIAAPQRLAFVSSFSDAQGNVVHHPMAPDWPLETLSALEFAESGGKTTVTLRAAPQNASEKERLTFLAGFNSMRQGWGGTFEKFEEYLSGAQSGAVMELSLPSDREIALTRAFNAPRELVWRAWTDPNLIPRWWGPRRYATIVDKMDLRPGGVWRYINRDADGAEFAFNGVYREIAPPERIVCTFEFEGMPGHVAVDTLTLEERDGKTWITSRTLFATKEDRDMMLGTDMEEGAGETYQRFAELLAELGQGGGAAAANDQEIVVARLFDAPRRLVWQAWTEPERLKRWWAPQGFTTPACAVDLRVGGLFHYCMRAPDGKDYWGKGVFQEIAPLERLVYVDSFADAAGNTAPPQQYGIGPEHPTESLVTVTFAEVGGKTLVTLRHEMPASVKERGMTQQGWMQMFERLAGELAG